MSRVEIYWIVEGETIDRMCIADLFVDLPAVELLPKPAAPCAYTEDDFISSDLYVLPPVKTAEMPILTNGQRRALVWLAEAGRPSTADVPQVLVNDAMRLVDLHLAAVDFGERHVWLTPLGQILVDAWEVPW